MNSLLTFLVLFCIVSSWPADSLAGNTSGSVFNVLQYGAAGNGKVDDSQAFLRAWKDVCNATTADVPVLHVPAGKTYLLNTTSFSGPCRSKNVHVRLRGTIVAPRNIESYSDRERWLRFMYINGLIIDGGGEINGRGFEWWKACKKGVSGACRRPTAVFFHSCDNLQVNGLKHLNSQGNHISINGCHGANFSNLYIAAPKDSPNTDGINIAYSQHLNIENSVIGTGDDCVAINGFSSFIYISGVTCGPGHGISIGSLGKGGSYETVEEIHVKNCTFNGTSNGARIKTWLGGAGYVRKVSFENIAVLGARNPIIIDQRYGAAPVNGKSTGLEISDITYRDVTGSSAAPDAITLNCYNDRGCTGIKMDHVRLACSIPGKQAFARCKDAHGTAISSSPEVPCLSK